MLLFRLIVRGIAGIVLGIGHFVHGVRRIGPLVPRFRGIVLLLRRGCIRHQIRLPGEFVHFFRPFRVAGVGIFQGNRRIRRIYLFAAAYAHHARPVIIRFRLM